MYEYKNLIYIKKYIIANQCKMYNNNPLFINEVEV